jgi:hypothetical protein
MSPLLFDLYHYRLIRVIVMCLASIEGVTKMLGSNPTLLRKLWFEIKQGEILILTGLEELADSRAFLGGATFGSIDDCSHCLDGLTD